MQKPAFRVLQDTLDKKSANTNDYRISNQYGDLLVLENNGKFLNRRTHLYFDRETLAGLPEYYEAFFLEEKEGASVKEESTEQLN